MSELPARSALLLTYQLPGEPSRFRVAAWRRLRLLGARPLHRALFLLPDSELNRLRLSDLAHDIRNWGGEAWLFAGESLSAQLNDVAERGLRPRRRGGRSGPSD